MSRTIIAKSTLESVVAPLAAYRENNPSCLHRPPKRECRPRHKAVDVRQKNVAGGPGDSSSSVHATSIESRLASCVHPRRRRAKSGSPFKKMRSP